MENLISEAFESIEPPYGPHVLEGHYDLIADGQIILPQVWETMIEPGWSITMDLWPLHPSLHKEVPLSENVEEEVAYMSQPAYPQHPDGEHFTFDAIAGESQTGTTKETIKLKDFNGRESTFFFNSIKTWAVSNLAVLICEAMLTNTANGGTNKLLFSA